MSCQHDTDGDGNCAHHPNGCPAALHPYTIDFLDFIANIWSTSGIPPELVGSSPDELAAAFAIMAQAERGDPRVNTALDHITADMKTAAAKERIAAMMGYC